MASDSTPNPAQAAAEVPQLLPCPFCGEPAALTLRPDNADRSEFVGIVSCFCGGYSACAHKMVLGPTEAEARDSAVRLWNRRAALAEAPPAVPQGWRLERVRGSIHVHAPNGGAVVVTPEEDEPRVLPTEVLWQLADALLTATPQPPQASAESERVRKVGGSFQHTGTVVSRFKTTAGEERIVIEFDAPVSGMLHVYRLDQVERTSDRAALGEDR